MLIWGAQADRASGSLYMSSHSFIDSIKAVGLLAALYAFFICITPIIFGFLNIALYMSPTDSYEKSLQSKASRVIPNFGRSPQYHFLGISVCSIYNRAFLFYTGVLWLLFYAPLAFYQGADTPWNSTPSLMFTIVFSTLVLVELPKFCISPTLAGRYDYRYDEMIKSTQILVVRHFSVLVYFRVFILGCIF